MQSGLTVVFILVISRHSICDSTLRVLTVTTKAKVRRLELFQQKHNFVHSTNSRPKWRYVTDVKLGVLEYISRKSFMYSFCAVEQDTDVDLNRS